VRIEPVRTMVSQLALKKIGSGILMKAGKIV
jgi:hypothetical protein